jgi:hypothetical protein
VLYLIREKGALFWPVAGSISRLNFDGVLHLSAVIVELIKADHSLWASDPQGAAFTGNCGAYKSRS